MAEWMLSAPCSPISPSPTLYCLMNGTTWSSNICILGRMVASGKFSL